jgi:hypothetical protein
MMQLFSVIYDPSTSSPFGLVVEDAGGEKHAYGLSEAGRYWEKSGNTSVPEAMITTGFAPYTKSAQEAMLPAITGDVLLSLSEIKEYVNPEMIYTGRTIKKNKKNTSGRTFSISKSYGKSKVQVAEYLAEKFKSSIRQATVVHEVKSANIGFSEKINTLKTASSEPGKVWLVDRVGYFLGRSTARRMGEKINSAHRGGYSENNRINRRVKSLIGNEEVDLSHYPIPERMNISCIERTRRI